MSPTGCEENKEEWYSASPVGSITQELTPAQTRVQKNLEILWYCLLLFLFSDQPGSSEIHLSQSSGSLKQKLSSFQSLAMPNPERRENLNSYRQRSLTGARWSHQWC